MKLFFFPFLFSVYFRYVDPCVVSIVSDVWTQSFFRAFLKNFQVYYYYDFNFSWFSNQCKVVIFQMNLIDSKSPQFSRNFLSIRADFINPAFRRISIFFSLVPKSSTIFFNNLRTDSIVPIITDITVVQRLQLFCLRITYMEVFYLFTFYWFSFVVCRKVFIFFFFF